MPLEYLPEGGLSTFYADESDNKAFYVIACVNVPTYTPTDKGIRNAWDDYFLKAKAWRRALKQEHEIPISKELKGSKLATGRNRYVGGTAPLFGRAAFSAYSAALAGLAFLPDASIFSVAAPRGYRIYGHTRLEAVLYAMFQRMQKHCEANQVSSLIFFDEGHSEYRKLYRRACVHLPTGSRMGKWESGKATENKPFLAAVKDANFKDSKQSHFVQIADLVAYATLLKMKAEAKTLSAKETNLGFGAIHDAIPRRVLNTRVALGGTDGIKRLS